MYDHRRFAEATQIVLTGKRLWFVLAIAECIKTDAARCQGFAFQIDGSFILTVTRHFQSSND